MVYSLTTIHQILMLQQFLSSWNYNGNIPPNENHVDKAGYSEYEYHWKLSENVEIGHCRKDVQIDTIVS